MIRVIKVLISRYIKRISVLLYRKEILKGRDLARSFNPKALEGSGLFYPP